jgi:LacI family transcriptional regulator/LacI family repressor for deo operon, udp, cdd, tsx, nupC, and nupG
MVKGDEGRSREGMEAGAGLTRVSIKDIARAAGVSYSTVSRALHDSPLIRPEVRQRIQDLARRMGYTPNALAQGLQARLTHSIGLVITTVADPFFVDVVQGVEEEARQAGFSVLLATSSNDPVQEIQAIETFSRRRVDGVIVAASRISPEYADRLARVRIPVVMINNQAEGDYPNLHSVSVDDYAGARLAMQHLLELGHRAIGYVGVTNRPRSNEQRLAGYRESLLQAGVRPDPGWVCLGSDNLLGDLKGDLRAGRCLAERILDIRATALFCYCDTVAVGAMMACRQIGLEIPGQVSVIGFDDNELCEIVDPPLTTIGQPKRAMGQSAVRMLLTSVNGGEIHDQVVQPNLVVRASTAPPGYFTTEHTEKKKRRDAENAESNKQEQG